MRFIIYGAGGIGGSIGARLHMADEDVVLIARGEHARVMQEKGMHFISPGMNVTLRIPTVAHPKEIDFQASDVVILCMKSQHTEMALRDLYDYAFDDIPVICCQNGVSNERMAIRRFARVYGMVVLVPAEHLQPGEVVNFAEEKAGTLDAGCYPTGTDEVIERVTKSIHDCGFSSIPQNEIMRFKYSKLLANLNNGVQAVTGEGSRTISRFLREEALACYEKAGIDCATAEENQVRRMEIRGGPVPGFERHGGSSLQSVLRQTGDIEADYLNGEIVQLGRLFNVPTPANRIVQRLANEAVRASWPIGKVSVQEMEQAVTNQLLSTESVS